MKSEGRDIKPFTSISSDINLLLYKIPNLKSKHFGRNRWVPSLIYDILQAFSNEHEWLWSEHELS